MSTNTTPQADKFFGTDGVRGAFGAYPLDRDTVHRLGRQLGRQLGTAGGGRVVLGGDTRDSTPTLCRWLEVGLQEGMGVQPLEVIFLGTIPTPGVAYSVRQRQASFGIAVSASHNPHPDNGIKLIDAEGYKWSPEAESELAQALLDDPTPAPTNEAPEQSIHQDALRAYADSLRQRLPGERPLADLRIALDMANGAASAFAAPLFQDLGAEVIATHDRPDGQNINHACGSTHPEEIAARTLATGCDLGFAFDGDADRVILLDERGEVRDGDSMLYLLACSLQAKGELPRQEIVATTMSNLGLEFALGQQGITLRRCGVGDREVVASMRREGLRLGGEQSGHIVNLAFSTTGDGLLTALQIAALRQQGGQPLSRMLAGFKRFPQVLLAVPIGQKLDFQQIPALVAARAQVEENLGQHGRLVLRYSGTEPLARVMIEGPDQSKIDAMAETLAKVLATELG